MNVWNGHRGERTLRGRELRSGILGLALLMHLPDLAVADTASSIYRIECEEKSDLDFPHLFVSWLPSEGTAWDPSLVALEVKARRNSTIAYRLIFEGKLALAQFSCPRKSGLFEIDFEGPVLSVEALSGYVKFSLSPDRTELLLFDTQAIQSALHSASKKGTKAACELVHNLERQGISTDDTEAFKKTQAYKQYLRRHASRDGSTAAARRPLPPSELVAPPPPSSEPVAAPPSEPEVRPPPPLPSEPVAPRPSPEEVRREQLAQAKESYRGKDYKGARQLLEKVLRADATVEKQVHTEALYYFGLVELTEGRSENALPYFEEAGHGGARQADFYYGYVLFEAGRFSEAQEVLQRFVDGSAGSDLALRAEMLLLAIDQRLQPPKAPVQPVPERAAPAGAEDLDHLVGRQAYARSLTLRGFREEPSRRFDSFRGRRVILHLWASWCPPCVKEIPSLMTFYEQHGEVLKQRGVELVTVSLDYTEEALERFVDRHLTRLPAGFRVYLDEQWQLVEILGTSDALPQTLVLDHDAAGTILAAEVGIQEWRRGSPWFDDLTKLTKLQGNTGR